VRSGGKSGVQAKDGSSLYPGPGRVLVVEYYDEVLACCSKLDSRRSYFLYLAKRKAGNRS
jgi:hypothetical protein